MSTVFIGRYRVISELGRGGMGIVYRGEDPALDRPVAIKILPPKKIAQKALLQRFLREARVSARLDHPHIIKVYDIGEEEGIYHIVMEFVEGQTLREYMESRTTVDVEQAARYFLQIAQALAYAHKHKIVHRDLKPENIMITTDNQVKVMDFGLAVLEDRHSLTDLGAVMGTIAYFAPEQAQGKKADHRADIYSLGVVFFELLTGRLPFEATNPGDMIHQQIHNPAPSLRTFNEAVPAALEQITLKTLLKNPEERYQNLDDLMKDLEGWFAQRGSAVLGAPGTDERRTAKESSKDPTPAAAPLTNLAATPLAPRPAAPIVPGRLPASPATPGHDAPPLASPEWLRDAAARDDEWGRYQQVLDRMRREEHLVDIARQEAADAAGALLCPGCGAGNTPDRKYCSECGTVLAAARATSREVAALTQRAQELGAEGRVDEAIASVEQALLIDPGYPDAHFTAGRLYLEQGAVGKAQAALETAARLAPQLPGPQAALGDLALRQEQRATALAYYRAALERAPADHALRLKLAFLYSQEGNLDRAIEEVQHILLADSGYLEAHRQLGILFSSALRVEEAIREFEWVLRFDPANAQVHQWLGELYARNNKVTQAERSYQQALRFNPDDPEVHAQLGALYQQQNREDLALKELNQAITLDHGNLEARRQLARMYIKHGQSDLALQELEEVAAFHPHNPHLHRDLGTLYLQHNLLDKALTHFEQSVNLDPTSAESHNQLGRIYLKKDYDDLSVQEYQKAVSLEPYKAEYHEDLGMAYYAQQKPEQAITEMRKAATLDAQNVDYHKALGYLYDELGRTDDAVKAYQKTLELQPADAMGHALLGKAFQRQGLTNMAIYELEQALRLKPASYLFHIYLARAYTQQGQLDKAIEAFRRAIEFAPDSAAPDSRQILAKAYRDLGGVYLDAGDVTMARQVLDTARRLMPNDARTLQVLSRVHLAQDEPAAALGHLTHALTLEPQNPEILADLGAAYDMNNEADLAVMALYKAVRLAPRSRTYSEALARVLAKLSRYPEAIQILNQAIAMATGPSDPLHWHIGQLYAAQDLWEPAAAEFERAVFLDSRNWEYLWDLAKAFERLNRWAEAAQYLERAGELAPDPETAKQLDADLARVRKRIR